MADGIIGMLQDEVGFPYNMIPTMSYVHGRGGFYGYGTLCGALSPACHVINLCHDGDVANALVNELLSWYCQFPFPEYQPANHNLITTVSESTLCHVSVTKFMQATGFKRSDPERGERCAGLTADVAKFTVQLLNAQADGTFTSIYKPAAAVGECMKCHSNDSHGKENCLPCHGDPHEDGFDY